MPPASSVFIVVTIILSQVAPYVANRKKLNVNGEQLAASNPDDLDVHVELLNSKTFNLQGFEPLFGRCCCDRDGGKQDQARKASAIMKNEKPEKRSGKCGLFPIAKCGKVDVESINHGLEELATKWSTLGPHSYHKTDDGICLLPAAKVKSIKEHFEGEDKLVFHDLHTAMVESEKFQENNQNFSDVGLCCCDKKKKTSICAGSPQGCSATSGRCEFFKTLGRKGLCGDAEAKWALQPMHNYIGVMGNKCALTEDQLKPLAEAIGAEKEVASYLKARADPKKHNEDDLVDLHVEFMNSKTFQLDQDLMHFQNMFGRCCCDQQGKKLTTGGLKDRMSALYAGAERTGECGLFPVYQCGAVTKAPKAGGVVSWHEFQGTEEGGKCILREEELSNKIGRVMLEDGSKGSIREYYKEQDSLVLYDLHTVLGKRLEEDADWEVNYGRCCCDKPKKEKADDPTFTSGRCGLFKDIGSCGDLDNASWGKTKTGFNVFKKKVPAPDWALQPMTHYTKVVGGKCALTEKQLDPLMKHYSQKLPGQEE